MLTRVPRGPARSPIDRASPADLVMLALDRGPVPEQVGALLLLEPETGLDVPAAQALLAERVARVPRLRQRLVPAPPGCGRPVWVDDVDYDIARHVRHLSCPPPGDEQALLDLFADLVLDRLPRSHPLWSAAFVTGLPGGSVGLVLVLHHALADGLGGLAVLGKLVDRAPGLPPADPVAGSPAAVFPRRPPRPGRLAVDAALTRAGTLARLPALWRRLRAALAAAGGLHPGRATACSLLRPTGPRRRLAVVSNDLDRLHAAAHRHGGTVNDVLLAAVGGALHTVLERRGESVGTLVMSVPVAIRSSAAAERLGNQVSPMLVTVAGSGGPAERVRQVAAATRVRKAAATEPLPAAMLGVTFRLAARLGLVHRYMNRQRQLHTLVTNLRGPGQPVTFAGARVARIVPAALGDSGNATVSFDALSYAGMVTVTVVADPDQVPDLPELATALRAELDTLAAAG